MLLQNRIPQRGEQGSMEQHLGEVSTEKDGAAKGEPPYHLTPRRMPRGYMQIFKKSNSHTSNTKVLSQEIPDASETFQSCSFATFSFIFIQLLVLIH